MQTNKAEQMRKKCVSSKIDFLRVRKRKTCVCGMCAIHKGLSAYTVDYDLNIEGGVFVQVFALCTGAGNNPAQCQYSTPCREEKGKRKEKGKGKEEKKEHELKNTKEKKKVKINKKGKTYKTIRNSEKFVYVACIRHD